MSKEILKIERQPFMPTWATHWVADSPIDTLAANAFYKVENGEVYVPDAAKFRLWNDGVDFNGDYTRFECLCSVWQYVYEITDLGCQQEKINRLNALVDDYDNSLRIEQEKCKQQRDKIIFLNLCCFLLSLALLIKVAM